MNSSHAIQVISGVITLIAAFLGLVTALIGYAISGRSPLPSPATPDQPKPRVFSPKSILKGWMAFALMYFLGLVVIIAITTGAMTFQSPQEYQWFFSQTKTGLAIIIALGFLCSGRASYVASKRAKAFRMTHGFLSVGSLYLLVGLLLEIFFPEFLAENRPPPDVEIVEYISVLAGALFGGIMASED